MGTVMLPSTKSSRHHAIAELVSRICEHAFLHLEAPPVRVTGWDTPFPYTLENDYLPLAHESGEFSLWSQGADGIYLPVLRPGGAQGDTGATYRAATDIRPLYAGFEPASRLSLRLSLGITALAVGAVVAGLLLITLVLRTFRALAAGLDADTAKLTDLALRQRQTTATLPALHWQELAGLGEALVQLRRDQQPATREAGAVAARPAPDKN